MPLHKDVRRQRALEAFEREIRTLSPERIRAMLAERRIRSPERVRIAEARLRAPTDGEAGAPAEATAGRRGAGRKRSRASTRGSTRTRAADAGARSDGHAARAAGARTALATTDGAATAGNGGSGSLVRQIGRVLGVGVGVASLAALALFTIRR